MTRQELAEALNGREYLDEMSLAEQILAKRSGLVVVFGASDDLMKFRGAVNDEIGCYEGGVAYLTSAGLLVNDCDNDDCPHFAKMKKAATIITAKWDTDGYPWVYQTTIPHATFDIMEAGDNYCRGIVFALSDVSAK